MITEYVRRSCTVLSLLIVIPLLSDCVKIDGDSLIGCYVLDEETAMALEGRFKGCTVFIDSDSTFRITSCESSGSNKNFKWRYSEGADFITVRDGDYSTGWTIERRFSNFRICWRLDEGKMGEVCFKKEVCEN